MENVLICLVLVLPILTIGLVFYRNKSKKLEENNSELLKLLYRKQEKIDSMSNQLSKAESLVSELTTKKSKQGKKK